ncbi:MAG: hypothetical protein KAS75_08850 [Planctomycetes bacterium]|nr:hypothetical protein [Planctomycetota bacterium]
MGRVKKFLMVCLVLSFSGTIFAADIILNEYNAVDSNEFLNGGDSSADSDGGRASDSYFGRIRGNGGDWFELVVITDHLDMRDWKLDIYSDSVFDETLRLTNHPIWSDLRSGTIITVSEDFPADISYDPCSGDWWINVQANNLVIEPYIEPSNFPVNNNNWQLGIRNHNDVIIFGPAGEGIKPLSGIGDTEVFRLEAKPSSSITADSNDYDDGKNLSTFGSPNRWGIQNFNTLRSVVAEVSTLTLLTPNGSETIMGGTGYDITWSNTGTVASVLIEFSIDNGNTWSEVYPTNVGNTGSYNWLVPIINSEQCVVRVTNTANLSIHDSSDGVFTTYECVADGDLTGDCIVNMVDFAIMAASWLECDNPYNPDCSE